MLKTAPDLPLDENEWREYFFREAFGQAVALGVNRATPVITPVHFIEGAGGAVEFHLHRANPLLDALRELPRATMSVVSAQAFIPSSWNSETGYDPMWSAPTSYYSAVQVTGATEFLEPAALADHLNREVAFFQPSVPIHHVQADGSYFGRALAAIVGVRVTIEQVEAKFKFGGNRAKEHRLKIAANLAQRGAPNDLAALAHLLRRTAIAEAN
ncbi:MAG: FMN-binding negative transcriptional regulator [Terriglobales bacterium]|jgi:transcriptional regulator